MKRNLKDYMEQQKNNTNRFKEHCGYNKLREILKEAQLEEQEKDIVLLQYQLLLEDTEKGLTKGDVETYMINHHPEIVTFIDLFPKQIPHIKFIWLFNKEDEPITDKCIENIKYSNVVKYNFRYEKKDILVYVINVEIASAWENSCNQIKNVEVDNARKRGYYLFEELKKRMIEHGMCWYTYGNIYNDFSYACALFPVATLAINEESGWSKLGYREDLDQGFRSTWEANVARLLNYKNIKWVYEPYSVELNSPTYLKAETINYIPDFELEDKSILEVKGFWDTRSKLKVSQFMEQYPERKYIVIDSDIYRGLDKKYKDVIPNWEQDRLDVESDIVQVVGIALPDRKAYVSRLKVGEVLQIIREPDNKYDPKAIRVNDVAGNQIGYLAKDCSSIYAPKIDMGFEYEMVISIKQPKVLQCKIRLVNSKKIILPEIFE